MKKIALNLKYGAFLWGMSFLMGACSQNSGTNETAEAPATEESADHAGDDHAGAGHDMAGGSSNKMMDLMHQNMSQMQGMKMTGDVDHDFATMMAVHHQGAISMSEEEVSNGTDPMLKEMANKTITSSRSDIEKLNSFTSSHQPATADTAKSGQLMQPMKDMMARMDHNMQGNTDHHFATMMSMHHQQGIDMAKVQLAEGKTPEMKEIARKIIDEQQKDKQKLEAWLQQHPQQ